jgi:hypothetical protein
MSKEIFTSIIIVCIIILIIRLSLPNLFSSEKNAKSQAAQSQQIGTLLSQEFHPEFPSLGLVQFGAKPTKQTYSVGSDYTQSMAFDEDVPTAYEIKLLYRRNCEQHRLVGLFNLIAKQFLNDPSNPDSRIAFTRELITDSDIKDFDNAYPKIIKIRRNGQVMEYLGASNYGSLHDWILNEGILF